VQHLPLAHGKGSHGHIDDEEDAAGLFKKPTMRKTPPKNSDDLHKYALTMGIGILAMSKRVDKVHHFALIPERKTIADKNHANPHPQQEY